MAFRLRLTLTVAVIRRKSTTFLERERQFGVQRFGTSKEGMRVFLASMLLIIKIFYLVSHLTTGS